IVTSVPSPGLVPPMPSTAFLLIARINSKTAKGRLDGSGCRSTFPPSAVHGNRPRPPAADRAGGARAVARLSRRGGARSGAGIGLVAGAPTALAQRGGRRRDFFGALFRLLAERLHLLDWQHTEYFPSAVRFLFWRSADGIGVRSRAAGFRIVFWPLLLCRRLSSRRASGFGAA